MRRDRFEQEAALAYRIDLDGSARRHLRAAQELCQITAAGTQPGSKAVGGYLFGIAGELAVKHMMRSSGMKPQPASKRRDDPFFAHFPELKTFLSRSAQGRRAEKLRKIADNIALFQYWDTQMRYAPTADLKPGWIAAWRTSAEALVAEMDIL